VQRPLRRAAICGVFFFSFAPWCAEMTIIAPPTDRRRSKRILKAIPILLSGSDIEGKQFSEQTRTLVLSRHGAGIFSTKKLAPQTVLIVRSVETNNEAAVRVIDQVAGTPEGYTYGVAFLDPSVNFWNVEFAPQPEEEAGPKSMILECASCHERETVNPNDVELDVYAINKSVSRYCANCGRPTSWKEASGAIETKPSSPSTAKADTAKADTKKEPAKEAAPAHHHQENRRKDVRARVNFDACIRHSGVEDIVACENLSRGGFCFRSSKPYVEKAMIEVALPYSKGEPAIFFKAKIMWVQELAAEKLFRCGAAYVKA
jgi:hypothetical protein